LERQRDEGCREAEIACALNELPTRDAPLKAGADQIVDVVIAAWVVGGTVGIVPALRRHRQFLGVWRAGSRGFRAGRDRDIVSDRKLAGLTGVESRHIVVQ